MRIDDQLWFYAFLVFSSLLNHFLPSPQGSRTGSVSAISSVNSKSEAKLFARLEVDDDYCLHISINSTSVDGNATGYRIFYTRTPDEKSSSSGWSHIEFETKKVIFTAHKNGKDLELVPNSRYIAQVAQMRNDGHKTIDELTEFFTGDEVPNIPTNVTIYIDNDGFYHVCFKQVIDSCNTEFKYVRDYTIEFTADNPTANDTEWTLHKVEGLNYTGLEQYVDIKLQELTISAASRHSFKVSAYNATNGLSSNVTVFELDAEARKPQITIKDGKVFVFPPSVTDDISLQCRVVSVPTANVSWHYKETDDAQNYTTKTIQLDDRTVVSELNIPKRIRSQTVECNAKNIYGKRSATIKITILGAGSPPTNISASNNKRGLLVNWSTPEIPNGDVMNYSIYVTEDRHMEDLLKWKNFTVSGDNKSILIATDIETTYYVRIQAVSTSGPGIISDIVGVPFVEEEVPLKVSIELLDYEGNYSRTDNESVELDPGSEIVFKCIVYGSPTPTLSYFWSNGTGLSSDETQTVDKPNKVRLYTYESDNLTANIYFSQELICKSKNALETANAKLSFIVNKPGIAPTMPRSSIGKTSEATLEWDMLEFGGENITNYKVYISQDTNLPLEKWQTFDVNGTRLDLYRAQVIPSATYYFKVSAVNNFGEGIRSEPTKFNTGSGAPRDPPRVMESEATNDNVLILLWEKPNEPNGEIQKYTIYYTKDLRLLDEDYKNWHVVEVLSNCSLCSYKMTQEKVGVRKDEDYRYRITAWNDLGESEPTEVKLFATLGKEFPIPTDLEAAVLKDNSVLITFDLIRTSQDYSRYVSNFFVSITADSDGIYGTYKMVNATVRFNSKKNRMVLKILGTDLRPDTSYWARARADDPDQNASWSKPVRFQTGPANRRLV